MSDQKASNPIYGAWGQARRREELERVVIEELERGKRRRPELLKVVNLPPDQLEPPVSHWRKAQGRFRVSRMGLVRVLDLMESEGILAKDPVSKRNIQYSLKQSPKEIWELTSLLTKQTRDAAECLYGDSMNTTGKSLDVSCSLFSSCLDFVLANLVTLVLRRDWSDEEMRVHMRYTIAEDLIELSELAARLKKTDPKGYTRLESRALRSRRRFRLKWRRAVEAAGGSPKEESVENPERDDSPVIGPLKLVAKSYPTPG